MSPIEDLNQGWPVYRRLLGYVRPYRKAFFFAVIGMILVAGTEAGFAALMQPLLDGTFVEKDPFLIKVMPALIIGIFVVRGVASFVSSFAMAWIGRYVVRDMRTRIFDHLLMLPTAFFDRATSGQLISKVIYDVEQVAEASSKAVTVLVQDTLTIIALLAFMFYINWKFSMLFLVMGPLLAVLVRYVTNRLRRVSGRVQRSMGDVTQVTQETIEAQRVIKIFGGHDHERRTFSAINENNRQQNMKVVATNAASVPITQLMAAIVLSTVIYIASGSEMMSVGTFMSFITAMMLLLPPLKRLTTINGPLQRGIAAAQSVFELLGEEAEQDQGGQPLERAKGDIRFENVWFGYDASKGDALRGIDLHIEPGSTVAFVGRSGSGKSTLVSLLPRFYTLERGRILLDGMDIRDINLQDLRRQIALVSQDVTLFNDTIAHNIAYGRLEEASEEEIIHAAEMAHAMDFIKDLPDGLQTHVGEHGVLLSGGQRQRLAIARAILKDAPVLILDEATSALDTHSERAIQDALEQLMKNRTTLVIAHRLSTIENADQIVVLHEGRMVESGTHRQLLAHDGQYAALHKMQFSNGG